MLTGATLAVALGLWLGGLGALRLAERLGARPRGELERQALALLLGLAIGPALHAHLVMLVGPLSTGGGRALLAALAALGALLELRARLARRGSGLSAASGAPDENTPWHALQGLALAGTLAGAAFAALYASSMPMHVFDPVYHFAYKGKLVYHEGFRTESWTDIGAPMGRIMTHPNYPPGLPALHAQVGTAGGAFSEDATRPLMALYALAAIALVGTALRRRGRSAALLGAFSLAWLPLLYYSQLPQNPWSWVTDESRFFETLEFSPQRLGMCALALLFGSSYAQEHWSHMGSFRIPDGWTLDGAADLPLAAMLLAACLCLGRALQRPTASEGPTGTRGDALIGGLLLGGAALLKNEGMALAALALLVFTALALLVRGGPPRGEVLLRAGLAVAAMLALVGPWLAIRGEIPSVDEDYPAAIARVFGIERGPEPGPWDRSPRSPEEAAARAPVVAAGFAQAFAHPLRWNLLWPLFWLVLLWRLTRPAALARHPLLPHLLLTVGAILAYGVILIVTPWDLPTLFTTAIPDRLLLHVAPLALWLSLALMWRRADGT